MTEWIRGGPEPTLVSEASFIPERLLSLRTRNSAAYKGLYALQMKNGAADWRTAEALSFAVWDDRHIDIHHIFPVAWCRRQSPPVPDRLCNSVINKTPIDAETNRRIGSNAPSRYLSRLQRDISPEMLGQVLRAHWLNPELMAADQFAECFVQRGEAMLDLIGRAMGKPMPSGRNVFWNALNSAGFVEEFDDPEDEHDVVGERAYEDDAAAAAD